MEYIGVDEDTIHGGLSMMTLNNENSFQTTTKTSSPYLEFTILLYRYGLLYLPTYHQSFCPKFFS